MGRYPSFLGLGLLERVAVALLELALEFGVRNTRGILIRITLSQRQLLPPLEIPSATRGATLSENPRRSANCDPRVSSVFLPLTGQKAKNNGGADNIRARILEHLAGDEQCVVRYWPSAFAFELVSRPDRAARHEYLVNELQPFCNGLELLNRRTDPGPWRLSAETNTQNDHQLAK
jgi:hypothetical protein